MPERMLDLLIVHVELLTLSSPLNEYQNRQKLEVLEAERPRLKYDCCQILLWRFLIYLRVRPSHTWHIRCDRKSSVRFSSTKIDIQISEYLRVKERGTEILLCYTWHEMTTSLKIGKGLRERSTHPFNHSCTLLTLPKQVYGCVVSSGSMWCKQLRLDLFSPRCQNGKSFWSTSTALDVSWKSMSAEKI